jgi:predicted dehydrogenase
MNKTCSTWSAYPNISDKLIRIALIGCGQIAEAHLREISLIPDAEVLGICDLERILAEDIADRFSIRNVFSNHKEMLEAIRPDVVHITSPPHTHRGIGLDVINNGCHAYIEKPFGINYQQALELIDAAKARNVVACAGFGQLYDLVSLRLKDFVRSGRLGDVVHIESFYGNSMDGTFSTLFLQDKDHWIHKLPGRLFHNIISHALYHIIPFMKHPIDQIVCLANDRTHTGVFLDELRVMMQSGNVTAYLTFTSSVSPIAQFIRLYGTKAIVEVDLANHTFSWTQNTGLPGPIARIKNAMALGKQYIMEGFRHALNMSIGKDRFFAGMGNLFRQLYENVRNGNIIPPVPYEEVLASSAIMDAINHQCQHIEPKRFGR